jgi:2'-5' RNA ligase
MITRMVRTFVAVDLPDEIRRSLGEAAQQLRGSTARLAFVDPALIHITLKFLGEVPEARVPAIVEALDTIPGAPFECTVGPIRGNSRSSPRVIWSAIEDPAPLAALAGEVEAALAPLGFAPETRPFRAHATVARVKSFHPSLLDRLKALPETEFGPVLVDRIRLKRSVLTPQGPLYDDLAEVVF